MAREKRSSVPVKATQRPLRGWDPFEMVTELQEELARRWGLGWPWTPGLVTRRLSEMSSPWTPRLDVYEKDNTLVAQAELPGVKKEDVQVTLDDGDLVIRGERKAEHEVKEQDYYRMERSYGSFQRRLPLPFDVKPEQVTANFKDGVLELRIPRPAESKSAPQTIRVN
jgi:HSP20 family protein